MTTFKTVLLTLLVVDSVELADSAELRVLRSPARTPRRRFDRLRRPCGSGVRHQLRDGFKAGVAAHWKAMSTESAESARTPEPAEPCV